MDVAIDVRGLTKRYGGVLAVDHISFKVRDGETFGFLGPNGAGKTTTIRMLIGILKPDEGSAIVNGFDIVKDPLSVREHIGVVPEVSNAYVDLSAWDNLMFISELYGIPKSERMNRATRLLKDFGLYDVRDRIVKGFSRGMKQRLLLCMALISDPEIIFLDEPTSGLDVESRRVVWHRIREENANGKTIFLSTHNMDEAQRLCHRIAIINHGRIAAIDTPEGLRAQSMELQCVEITFNMPVDSKEFLSGGEISKISFSGRKVKIYTADP
ncbi:ATP-binding protein, partial [Candidatus Bathyarchaeota archaeon]